MRVIVDPTERIISATMFIRRAAPRAVGFVAVRTDEEGEVVSYWKGGYGGEARPSSDPLEDEPYLFRTVEHAMRRVEMMKDEGGPGIPHLGVWIYPDWYPEQTSLVKHMELLESHQLPGSFMSGKRQEKTIVIFRKYPEGDILAIFPELPADRWGTECMVYQHVGQHGGGDCSLMIRATKPAKASEYKDLKRELEMIGYVLDVHERSTPEMKKHRQDEADAAWHRSLTK